MSKAFPGFMYPSIFNANGVERTAILEGLDRMPLHHVSAVGTVSMVPDIPSSNENVVILGRAFNYVVANEIELSRYELTTPGRFPEHFEGVLFHEVGHTTDYTHLGCTCCGYASSRGPWGKGEHITTYATTNQKEDFADSYRAYLERPEELQQINPEKFAEMERIHQPNRLQRLVDRREFRETGKLLADVLGPDKATRLTLEGARTLGGGLQLLNGALNWIESSKTGDGLQHASGILNTAAGALMLSGTAPMAAVGLQGANFALTRSVGRGELTAEEVGATVSLPTRPLESLFGRQASKLKTEDRPGKVLAVAAGGGIGASVGSIAGPYLGVLAGYQVAGAVGGAVGMVAGGVLGFLGGSEIGGRIGEMVGNTFVSS